MKVHVGKRMQEVFEAVTYWADKYSNLLASGLAKECEEEWGPNYGIFQYGFESWGDTEFFDFDGAASTFRSVVEEAAGDGFEVFRGDGAKVVNGRIVKKKLKDGQLYLHFHGYFHRGEVEAYRYRKPKKKAKRGKK